MANDWDWRPLGFSKTGPDPSTDDINASGSMLEKLLSLGSMDLKAK